jgi:hypothetical protein
MRKRRVLNSGEACSSDEQIEGRGGPIRECFSHGDDATLFGGFGGHEVGGPDPAAPGLPWGHDAWKLLHRHAGRLTDKQRPS